MNNIVYQYRRMFMQTITAEERRWTPWQDCSKDEFDERKHGISKPGAMWPHRYETRIAHIAPFDRLDGVKWPDPYASIEVDADKGISVVERPSYKTVEVYSRHQIEKMLEFAQVNQQPAGQDNQS